MKFVLVFQAILATCIILCDARHGFDHHGRHHEDFRQHSHHSQHGWQIDLKKMETPKNETISIDVTRKSSSIGGNEDSTIKVTYIWFNLARFNSFRACILTCLFCFCYFSRSTSAMASN